MRKLKYDVPSNISSKGLMYSSLSVAEEYDEFMKISGSKSLVDSMANFNVHAEPKYTISVLSHKYDARRSKFLTDLKSESELHDLDHKYNVFVYEDQRELYVQFEQIKNVDVVYIPLCEKYSSLTGKRKFIFDWNVKHNVPGSFYIEDDCSQFHLPILSTSKSTGNISNKKFYITYNFAFKLWEYFIEMFDTKFGGLSTNMDFTFRSKVLTHYQAVQAVYIDTTFAHEHGIEYDEHSGWDDYDYLIQHYIKGHGADIIFMGYYTPPLKSGVSVESSSMDALQKRCRINTEKLINKWGTAFVKLDQRKGLYNAKVNLRLIKKAKAAGIDLNSIVGKTADEVEYQIKTIGTANTVKVI